MQLKNEILKSHSKHNTVRIAGMIGQDVDLFRSLTILYFDYKNQDIAKKAAWVLRYSVERHPHLIKPYLGRLVNYLGRGGLHDAIKRNGLGILEIVQIPKNLYGQITNICFKYIQSFKEPVSVKAYSLGILDKIGEDIPEIRHELKLVIEELLPYQSAGFIARAKRILLK